MRRLIALLCALPLILAACGGNDEKPASGSGSSSSSSSSSGGGGGQTLNLTAEEPSSGKFAFDKTALEAKAGKVTLDLKLPGGLKAPHAIAVEGNGVDQDGPVVQAGSDSTVTVDLKPGKYEFYCPVDGHKGLGMEGELTVS
ncbi:MAG: hypothetical protein QOI80_2557 [Solirubrobacteraceae bacterium]|jgi:plastocyanin|nr:hypothetical protein [Solirubrobacteraceae bacterium]